MSRFAEVWGSAASFGLAHQVCRRCDCASVVIAHDLCTGCRAHTNAEAASHDAARRVLAVHPCLLTAMPNNPKARCAICSATQTRLWACDRCDVRFCNACLVYAKPPAAAAVPAAVPGPPTAGPPHGGAGATAAGVIAAHMRLFQALAAQQPAASNLFCSTASLHAALGMAALGATPGSETQRQLLSLWAPDATSLDGALAGMHAGGVLRPLPTGSGIELCVANALFVSRDGAARDLFQRMLASEMDAQVLPLRTAADVNAWCAEHTRGAIAALLPDGEPVGTGSDVAFLLANALFFKGAWRFPFQVDDTRDADFVPGGGLPTLRVPLMTGVFADDTALHAGVVGRGSARVVRVPYGTAASPLSIEAWFVLPSDAGPEALAAVGTTLGELWPEIVALAARPPRRVIMSCPRFKIDSGCVDVKPALHTLGIVAPFAPQGGFNVASSSADTHIGSVLHRVVCAVDEQGTTAAAVSAVMCEDGCCSDEEADAGMVMTLDRPFWMAIVLTDSSVPLFLGRVCVPQQ